MVTLFYFIKHRRLVKIIDNKIGLGDILILPAIGLTMDIVNLVVFFSIGFFIAAMAGFYFKKKEQSIPLAGIVVSWHFIFAIMTEFFPGLCL